MRADLVVDALKAAERTRGSLAGTVMHTDHGAQGGFSRSFADACREAGVTRSMSAVGSSADNALAESFHATCERETLQGRRAWDTEREARLDLFRRLHRYNTVRRHSRLGHRSPIAYEHSEQHHLRWPKLHNPCSRSGVEARARQQRPGCQTTQAATAPTSRCSPAS
ncbi:integrase core domain-containing protein [Streptomyces sp. NPDC004232]|uniref:integrase core domain-containing protein n=1 Tax=Streptomyces sp. NPDC004232 TaxID=3154454 RepID=UPI001DB98D7E|nr:integrase core domain-containing protein [Streptomyces sp. tea 10]